MGKLPDSISIAFWVVGACWLLAIIGYAFGVSREWIFSLVAIGALTGLAEWYQRRG